MAIDRPLGSGSSGDRTNLRRWPVAALRTYLLDLER
jgi:hypothetical protein